MMERCRNHHKLYIRAQESKPRSALPVTYSRTGPLTGLDGSRATSVDIILRSAVKGYCRVIGTAPTPTFDASISAWRRFGAATAAKPQWAKQISSTMTATTRKDAIMTICLQLWRSLTSRRTVLVNGR